MAETEKKLHAVLAKPGEDATIIILTADEEGSDYEDVRKAIGGIITGLGIPRLDLAGYCHDEALLEAQPWNRFLPQRPNGAGTYIAGNILIVGSTDDGYDRDMTDAELKWALEYLNSKCTRLPPAPSSVEMLEELTGRPAHAIAFSAEEALKLGFDPEMVKEFFREGE
jgi:hypothetical protein